MKYVSKYPKDVYTALTSTKTFSVRGELFTATAFSDEAQKKAGSPYKVYDESFSRFIFTVVEKNGDKKTYPAGNISVNEIPEIIERSKNAKMVESLYSSPVYGAIRDAKTSSEKSAELSNGIMCGLQHIFYFIKNGKLKEKKNETAAPALPSGDKAKSVTITLGNFKGKTPYAVLVEDPSKKDALLQHADFLSKNLQKYPKNQEQIDAIKEAVLLLEKGAMNADGKAAADASVGASDIIQIYAATPRALIRKADENGFCPVYEISVDWHLGNNFPVEVTVKNYRAPYKKNDNGTINPVRSKAVDIVSNNFRMTSGQWFDCLYKIESHMRRFELLSAKKQFEEAETADRINRKNGENQG